MSIRKKYRKYVNKAKPYVAMASGGLYDGGSSKDSDSGQRSEAAGRMVKVDTKKQAGGGQIKYKTEEWQE